MKILKIFLSFFIIALFICDKSKAEISGEVFKNDVKASFSYLGYGFLGQFNRNNLVHSALFTPALWHSFQEDDRYASYFKSKKHIGLTKIVSDSAIFMNFPFFSMGMYYLGKKKNNDRLVEFAKEFFAAHYLAAVQVMALSFIEVNQRPDTARQSFWETAFRGKSSFPSGHVLPFTVLTWKVTQFYGPLYALIPLPFALATAYERLESGRHYMSDVVGGIFMGIVSSEGVRAAARNPDNHPFYKWVYEHQASVFPVVQEGHYALNFSYSF